jgi:REP element-mobilizing transposase RayT
MKMANHNTEHGYLKRLPAAYYRGHAYIHWSMSIDKRKKGWLDNDFHFKFREILTHTMFRYGLTCPIYCCMPDHIHLLWIGLSEDSDQRIGAKYLRKHLNPILEKCNARFQKQPYEHVLREDEKAQEAFEQVVVYIARNPERAELVKPGCHQDYPFMDCLIPGYPELHLWQNDFWNRFWRTHAHMRLNGLFHSKKDG